MKTKLLPLAAILSLATFGTQANAQALDSADIQTNAKGAYAVDSDGDVVRDSWNRCVRTNYWTPETAINKCEGIEEPKPAPVVVAAPAPAPVAAPAPAPVVMAAPAKFIGHFDFDLADLKTEENASLNAFADYMTATPASKIAITGHTDSSGPAEYNQILSEKRASDVADYLAGKGISADRMTTSGMGETAAIADNSTKAGRAENRRVEVEIVK